MNGSKIFILNWIIQFLFYETGGWVLGFLGMITICRWMMNWKKNKQQMQRESRNKNRINVALKLNKHALYVHFIDGTNVASHIYFFICIFSGYKFDGINSMNETMRTAQFA